MSAPSRPAAPVANDLQTFPGLDRALPSPTLPSLRKRLPYLALAALNRVVPKSPTKIVLHSTVDIEDGLLAVAEEAAARGQRATLLLEEPRRASLLAALSPVPVRTVPKWSVRGLAHYLTAGQVMTTGNLHGNTRPPQRQNVVALWHGEPPTKTTARFEGQGGLRASYAPVCSTVGRAYRSVEFDVHPLRVPIVGAPRNDRMLRADRQSVRRTLLGEQADRPTLVWMPSYRVTDWKGRRRSDVAGERSGLPFSVEDVHRIDDWLVERDARVVVKVHHRDAQSFPSDCRAVRVLTQGDLEQRGLTLYPALSAFDGLITDMSSVWLDYLLLDKPMVFAFPDVEDYRQGRGLNLEPFEQWVPGPFARTVDELLAGLADVVDGRDPMAEERRRARLRFHQFADDRSAQRLLDGLGLPPRAGGAPARAL